jgi:uncharacterized protein (DUF427 family)
MQCQIGNRVLANWTHDSYWYPATVQNIEGERIYIRFDDGDKEWTTFDHLMKIDIEVGDRVQCRWKGGAYYYIGHVAQQQDEKIYVHYDDGDKEWTTISFIRVTR